MLFRSPKTLNKFVDLANSLQLPNDVMTNVAGPNVPVQGAWWNFQGNASLLVAGKLITTENLHEMIKIFRQVCW